MQREAACCDEGMKCSSGPCCARSQDLSSSLCGVVSRSGPKRRVLGSRALPADVTRGEGWDNRGIIIANAEKGVTRLGNSEQPSVSSPSLITLSS